MLLLTRIALIASAAAALLSVALPSTASAATPCWKKLINDWYDGRIDKTYPIHCYQEAITKLPSDAQDYSSASDDIRRALLAAIRDERGGGKPMGPAEDVPLAARNPLEPYPNDTTPHDGFFRQVLEKLGPKNADSVPVPLLVLAAIAFLLLAAAGASYGLRWYQARRVEVAPAPQPSGKQAENPLP